MTWPVFRQVRARLTLWYMGILTAVFLVFLVGTSWVIFTSLSSQLERYIVQDLETVEGLVTFNPGGLANVREDYHNRPESRFVLERYVEIVAPDGAVLFRNPRLGSNALGDLPFPGEGVDAYSIRDLVLDDGTRVAVASRRHSFDGREGILRIGYSMEPIWQRVWDWAIDTIMSFVPMLLVAGAVGYQLTRRALEPIDGMTRRVEAMSPERLDERLPVSHADDELAHLASVFNGLLTRVEVSFEKLRRFTSDASHELRTPLAAIRSVGEVGLQRAETPEELRDVIGSMLEEVNRLTVLVDNLLNLARADRNAVRLRHAEIPIYTLVKEATSLVDVLAEEKDQEVQVTGDHDAIVVGDAVFLRQALVNIVHNAVKYSPSGGTIRVHVWRAPGARVAIDVADNGPGIGREHLSKVFDRFYRVEESRSRDAGGAGLGLSIARWAVEAHGGTIELESKPGEGALFRIVLPALDAKLTKTA